MSEYDLENDEQTVSQLSKKIFRKSIQAFQFHDNDCNCNFKLQLFQFMIDSDHSDWFRRLQPNANRFTLFCYFKLRLSFCNSSLRISK